MVHPGKVNAKQAQPIHAPFIIGRDESEVIRALGRKGKTSRTEISNIMDGQKPRPLRRFAIW